jgi:hypothetical protein
MNPIVEKIYKHESVGDAFRTMQNVTFNAVEANKSYLNFDIRPVTGAVLLMDPLLEVTITIEKQAANLIDMKREYAARQTSKTSWAPRTFLDAEAVLKRTNVFPIQSSCSRIQQKFDDISIDCDGTLEVPVINRVYENEALRRKAIALGFPYQKWRWPRFDNLDWADTENKDALDPSISDRIFGKKQFTGSGQMQKAEDLVILEANPQEIEECQAEITFFENLCTGLFKPCLNSQDGHHGKKTPILGHLSNLNLQFIFASKLSERLFSFYQYVSNVMQADVNFVDGTDIDIIGGSIFENQETGELVYPRLVIKKVTAKLHTQWGFPFQ